MKPQSIKSAPQTATESPFGEPQLGLGIASPPLDLALEPADTEHGAIFTRRRVAELILDLAGYTADQALHERVAIEPAADLNFDNFLKQIRGRAAQLIQTPK